MAFVQAMNTPDLTRAGVNGAEVLTEEGVGDYRVSLFTMLNRGLMANYVNEYVTKIYKRGNVDEMRDIIVMAFQTRDIRGGKGERQLFYDFMTALYNSDKDIVHKVIKLIPEYGYWRDMWELLRFIPELETDIFTFVKQTFLEDLDKCTNNHGNQMTLLSKWLPREGCSSYKGLARKLANFIYSDEESERKRIIRYRKDTSLMNKTLKTVEINMCGKSWSEITPQAVPGRCLKLHTKAFLNEPLKKKEGDESNTLRYPDSEDRMKCRENFKQFTEDIAKGTKKVNGANVIMPHELVEKTLNRGTTVEEHVINQGQWEAICEETLKLGGLGRCVPMCDFSASMSGLPKLISLSLGLLVSEINHSAFKDHILSFDSEPVWHSFRGLNMIKEKLNSIKGFFGQGTSTNFYKACMRIIEKMVQSKVPVGEEPESLIVFTDMGFDNACGMIRDRNMGWKGQLEQIRDEFKKAGESVWGEGNGWTVPRIVIWNISEKFKDFHAKPDQEGVVQLSGWSPSMLKALQTTGVQVMTPYQGMRAILDNERYDPVRSVWNELHP
jgi:hypothetical protein